MTQQLTIDQTDAATVAASHHPVALQEVYVYSHSTLLYWWPAWAFGFVIALLNLMPVRKSPWLRLKAASRIQRLVSLTCRSFCY
jgi:hypothetical protein